MAGRKKVAVLQTDADLAELSRLVLESLGYEVRVLDCTVDAIAAIKEYKPDALVMDLRPRPAYGWETLKRLEGDPDTVGLPVVTVVALDKDVKQALMYGNVVQVLLAPYGIDELADKVKAAVESAPLLQRRRDQQDSMGA